jgi:putative colanic acid biosynthesis glycosyltransferase WcaI
MVGLETPGPARTCLTLYVGPPRGGCYERLRRVVRALLARGWTVHFVGTQEPLAPHPGLRFVAVAGGAGSPSPGLLWRASRQAARIVRRERIPLVFTFGAVYTAPLGPLLARSGARVVTFLRGSLREQERARGSGALRRAAARAAERLALAASDRVVAVSRALAARAGAKGEILPNEAPAAASLDAAEARRALGLPAGAFIAGYAGAIAPIKSLETLLEAARHLPPLHVALLGFGSPETAYELSLRARAAALEGRVHLFAWRPDARTLLAACDVVVLPSLDEGCPNLLLEAMAHDRPCVGARCAGIEEMLVHDALLFPPGDGWRLGERLDNLRGSPAARASAVVMGRQRAEAYRFDWDARAVEALEAALR